MRIYKLDGTICFDTDDFNEARLLDEYAAGVREQGAFWATATIASWLDELGIQPVSASGVWRAPDDLARRIRDGEWRLDL